MTADKGKFGYRDSPSKVPDITTSEWFDTASFLSPSGEPMTEDTTRPHYLSGKLLFLFLALILVVRLTNLQIVESAAHRFLAEGNRIRRQVTVAPRGAIVDRNGNVLASNDAGYNLEIIPSELPRTTAEREVVIQAVAQEAHLAPGDIAGAIQAAGQSSLEPIILAANLPRDEAIVAKIRFANLPGVLVDYVPTRQYRPTAGLAHLLGYTSRMTKEDIARHPDYNPGSPIGRAGLEGSYDDVLRGVPGVISVEVDASGRPQRNLDRTPPQVGQTLHLTLDLGLQTNMAAALQEALEKSGAKHAAAVALDPRDGGVLAAVSLPGFDNNVFARGITPQVYKALENDPDKPLINRVTEGVYPPGSTIKPFVAAAGLQESVITAATRLDTSAGVIKIGQWSFPDWKVHGITDVKLALAESNDIFFYAVGGGWNSIAGLGVDRLKKYLIAFGFGQESGVDFTADQSGLVPDAEWKKRTFKENWYIGDTYHLAIGQGYLLVTPLQVARGISGIANGGRLVTPHIAASRELPTTGERENLSYSDKPLPLSPQTILTVKEGMRLSVQGDTGSARQLRDLPFSSGGKTGTSQFGRDNKTHAWFAGFAPYDDPQIVVVVVVEGGGEGNVIAAPVAKRVLAAYLTPQP